jgi:hypothetical protein
MTQLSAGLLLLAVGAYAENAVPYELRYAAAGDSAVSIQITLPAARKVRAFPTIVPERPARETMTGADGRTAGRGLS